MKQRGVPVSREEIHYTRYFRETMECLSTKGLLLGSYDSSGKANIMTIGWGTIGCVWSRPIWIVLVRPSRHTYRCIEASGAFSVNVPSPEMEEACAFCGTRSGRDTDKFSACRLTAEKGLKVSAPVVAECPVVYECRVVHSNDVLPPRLAGEIGATAYRDGDYHRVYWGEILDARAERDALKILGKQ